jgi:hypothetical protein
MCVGVYRYSQLRAFSHNMLKDYHFLVRTTSRSILPFLAFLLFVFLFLAKVEMIEYLKFLRTMMRTGLPDFSWYNIPKRGKMYQITTKYTKLPQDIPNYHKIYQITSKYTKLPQKIPNYHKRYQITTKDTK